MNVMLDSPQTEEKLLDVNNIEVIYNHVILVLKGVSLSVPKGGITALLGGNGAGKTTTLKNQLGSHNLRLGGVTTNLPNPRTQPGVSMLTQLTSLTNIKNIILKKTPGLYY